MFSELEGLFYNIIWLHHKRVHMLLENLGVYPSQPFTLFFINKYSGLSQRELAGMLKIKPASITVMLQKMEKSNLVTRCNDEQDQRITRVYITYKGKENLEAQMKALKILSEDMFGTLSSDDITKLSEILKVINKSLSDSCGETEIKKFYKGDDFEC